MASVLAPGICGLVLLAALLIGRDPFALAVALLAALVVIDAAGPLARTVTRPLLPAAVLLGAGLPLLAWLGTGDPWAAVPAFAAAAFGVTVLLALLARRRGHIVDALAVTLAAGVLAGLGAATLVLLSGLAEGLRWLAGLAALAAATELAPALWGRLRANGRRAAQGPAHSPPAGVLTVLAPPALAAAVVATVLALTLDPPFSARIAAILALVVLVAVLTTRQVQRILVAEGRLAPGPGPGHGVYLAAFDALLLAAPAVYLVARSAVV